MSTNFVEISIVNVHASYLGVAESRSFHRCSLPKHGTQSLVETHPWTDKLNSQELRRICGIASRDVRKFFVGFSRAHFVYPWSRTSSDATRLIGTEKAKARHQPGTFCSHAARSKVPSRTLCPFLSGLRHTCRHHFPLIHSITAERASVLASYKALASNSPTIE